ncbi:replication-relaxation family protein [Halobacillus sp. H74]|uniref:replication-relaxation family protein n=1 Tax=Halobacillus sp. H74 TaxID=3457436 RepID=UPI003FCD6277
MAKELYLTKRDQNFLEDLYDMTFLDVDYIQTVIYHTTSRPAIYRRLKKMEEEGYIVSTRLPLMDDNPSGRSKNIYTLDTKGWYEVQEIIGECEWDSRWTKVKAPSYVHHQTMLSMVKAAYQAKEGTYFRFKKWLNERRSYWEFSDNKKDVVRPDGSMILQHKEHEDGYGYFMFELERSRQRPEVSIKKLQRYNRYCKEQAWKKQHVFGVNLVDPPRIIWVSNRQNEMLKLIEHTKDVKTDYTSGILYTTYDQITNDPYGEIFFAKDSKDPMKQYGIADPIVKE